MNAIIVGGMTGMEKIQGWKQQAVLERKTLQRIWYVMLMEELITATYI